MAMKNEKRAFCEKLQGGFFKVFAVVCAVKRSNGIRLPRINLNFYKIEKNIFLKEKNYENKKPSIS